MAPWHCGACDGIPGARARGRLGYGVSVGFKMTGVGSRRGGRPGAAPSNAGSGSAGERHVGPSSTGAVPQAPSSRPPWKEAKRSLRYASPYLVFTLLPAIELWQQAIWGWRQIAAAALLALMIGLYVYLWTACPLVPPGSAASRRFLVPWSALVLSIIGMIAMSGAEAHGLVFMWSYAATPWVLLGPSRLMGAAIAALIGATAVSGAAVGADPWLAATAVIVSTLSSLMVLIVRTEIERSRVVDSQLVASHQARLEHERAQLDSDLHDILGQDLTGLSIKAELAVRLLEADRTEQAAAEMRSIAALARQTMQDVRTVVQTRREWSVDYELDCATDLLAARGISLHLVRADTALPGPQQGAAARTIREGLNNVLKHAAASNCWIELGPNSLVICNDGAPRQSRRETGAADLSGAPGHAPEGRGLEGHGLEGHGLTGLRERVRPAGQLTWHQRGGEWELRLMLDAPGDSTGGVAGDSADGVPGESVDGAADGPGTDAA